MKENLKSRNIKWRLHCIVNIMLDTTRCLRQIWCVQHFKNWICFCVMKYKEGNDPTQLGPTRKYSLDHWTISFKWTQLSTILLPLTTDDRNEPSCQMLYISNIPQIMGNVWHNIQPLSETFNELLDLLSKYRHHCTKWMYYTVELIICMAWDDHIGSVNLLKTSSRC